LCCQLQWSAKESIMARQTKRLLTDEQWQRIAPHLPRRQPRPKDGQPPAADRECLEGILWLLRTGTRWQDIPVDLPSGSTCWRRLRDWASDDILLAIHSALIGEQAGLGAVDLKQLLADATIVRAKQGAPRLAKPRSARA
jgi:transposase